MKEEVKMLSFTLWIVSYTNHLYLNPGDDSSDSESVFLALNSQSWSGSRPKKWQQQEMLPLQQLQSRAGRAGFTGHGQRAKQSANMLMVEEPLLPPKPQLDAVLENDIQENESEDEMDRAAGPSASSVRWAVNIRDERHFDAAKGHFPGRKE